MTSNAADKSHPLHEEFMEYHRVYDRSPKRKAKRNARMKEWRDKNPERQKEISARSYIRTREVRLQRDKSRSMAIRLEMVFAYGGRCVCCGERDPHFLSIDHIFNDGYKDPLCLTSTGKRAAGARLFKTLKDLGWPKDRYQLLCFNCNLGKNQNGGICPHKAPRLAAAI